MANVASNLFFFAIMYISQSVRLQNACLSVCLPACLCPHAIGIFSSTLCPIPYSECHLVYSKKNGGGNPHRTRGTNTVFAQDAAGDTAEGVLLDECRSGASH